MNIVLFDPSEIDVPLGGDDPRARHVVEVLRCREGDCFDCGVIDGRSGKARIMSIGSEGIRFEARLTDEPVAPVPVTLLVGLPRPQTVRRILRDAASLGVTRIDFVRTEKGEASYAKSSVFRDGSYRRYLLDGTATSFTTRIPRMALHPSLRSFHGASAFAGVETAIALDNYEAEAPLSEIASSSSLSSFPSRPSQVVLAVGSERGWSDDERVHFRRHGYRLASLGTRVLRTETAAVSGLSVVLAGLGYM